MSCCFDCVCALCTRNDVPVLFRMSYTRRGRGKPDTRRPGGGRIAFAGMQTRTPHAPRDASADCVSHPFSSRTKRFRFGFARLGGERVTFCFGRKSPKTTAPGMPVSATSCCLNFPAMLADHAPARTRASMRSDMRALLARSTALLGVMRRRDFYFDGGHPWPRSKRELTACFVVPSAHDARQWGPSNTANGRRVNPQDGAQEVRQFAVGPWMARRRTPAAVSGPVVHGWTKGVFAGWHFFGPPFFGHAKKGGPPAREAGGKRHVCRSLDLFSRTSWPAP